MPHQLACQTKEHHNRIPIIIRTSSYIAGARALTWDAGILTKDDAYYILRCAAELVHEKHVLSFNSLQVVCMHAMNEDPISMLIR